MSLGWILASAIAMGGGLEVIPDTPDALCPTNEDVREALDERLGQIDGGSYRLHHGIVRDGSSGRRMLRLRLLGEDEALLLERSLPVDDAECGNLAVVVALVVDTYFSSQESAAKSAELEGPAGKDSPVGAAATDDATGAEVIGTDAATTLSGSEKRDDAEAERDSAKGPPAQPNSQPQPGSVTIFFGGGVDTNASASLAVGGRLRFGKFWMAQVHGLFQPVPAHVHDKGYELRLARQILGIGVGGVWSPIAFLRLHLAPTLGLHLEAVELEGDQVEATGIRWRGTGAIGASTSVEWLLGSRISLGVEAQLHATILGQSYEVQNAEGGGHGTP